MTIQEAIETIKYDLIEKYGYTEIGEALNIAIRSLEAWEDVIQACSDVVPTTLEEKLGVAQIHAFVEHIEKGNSYGIND